MTIIPNLLDNTQWTEFNKPSITAEDNFAYRDSVGHELKGKAGLATRRDCNHSCATVAELIGDDSVPLTQGSESFWFPSWKVGRSEYHTHVFRGQRNQVERRALVELVSSVEWPVESGLSEDVQALMAQENITGTIWSVSESTWRLDWSGKKMKPGKSRSSPNWINTYKSRGTIIPVCSQATGRGTQRKACLAERATQKFLQHLNLITP